MLVTREVVFMTNGRSPTVLATKRCKAIDWREIQIAVRPGKMMYVASTLVF